ncbi:MAG: hypothetical protein CSB44_03475 [Gammaproteobacteria bacterium]|nr:MAG: hypothetical protein CSB44_03475 [Gammaproteobacteria bacterium]
MSSSLLALLDDITMVLDDVAAMTKLAAKKTAGVLGDDLALNAEQVTGVRAEREIPVIWAVAKGSFVNKLIIVPVALAISAIAPFLITPLLLIGGLFLCYEGVHKVLHKFLHPEEAEQEKAEIHSALIDENTDMVAFEKEKIKGAIRTDFILSAEIIVIALGTVAESDFTVRLTVLAVISLLMIAFVYGLVAGIVKLDDLGRHLSAPDRSGNPPSRFAERLGEGLLWFSPILMKTLSVVGTAAMFLVGGGIVVHAFHWIAEHVEHAAATVGHLPALQTVGFLGTAAEVITGSLLNGLVGFVAGGVVFAVISLIRKLRGSDDSHGHGNAAGSAGH